jgi:glycosyltransferase domain-containing protein
MVNSQLTLLLVLKDRTQYTRFLMQYLNERGCPFKIIVADGGAETAIKEEFRDPNKWKNLSYDYIEFPYDEKVSDFYKKMSTAAQLVTTPFVVMIDNDDIPLMSAFYLQVHFLCQSPSFSSSRGQLIRTNFGPSAVMAPGTNQRVEVLLDLKSFGPLYHEHTGSVIASDESAQGAASQRMQIQSEQFHSNWHNVIRTSHFQTAVKLLCLVNPSSMRFADQFLSYMMTVWGNSRRSGEAQLLHGVSTPSIRGIDAPQHFPEISVWLNSDEWCEDWRKFSTAIAMAVTMCDGKDPKKDPRFLISSIESFEWMYSQKANIKSNIELFEKRSRESRSFTSEVDAVYPWGEFEEAAYKIISSTDHTAKEIEFEKPSFDWKSPLSWDVMNSAIGYIDQEIKNFSNWYGQSFYNIMPIAYLDHEEGSGGAVKVRWPKNV